MKPLPPRAWRAQSMLERFTRPRPAILAWQVLACCLLGFLIGFAFALAVVLHSNPFQP